MNFRCTRCSAPIQGESLDLVRQLATCSSCGSLVDLKAQIHAQEAGPAPRARARVLVTLPRGMTITADATGLSISRRWLRAKHFVMLAIIGAATAGLAYAWTTYGFHPWMAFAAFFVGSWDLLLLTTFVNSTTVSASQGRVMVKHGPLPNLFYPGQSVPFAQIDQLYAANWNSMFEVGAVLKDSTRISLVRPLVTKEQAHFIEQQLERRLGITDLAIAGEVDSELPLRAGVPAAVPQGLGAGLALVPLIAVGVALAVVFLVILPSEVKGSLETQGQRLGRATFVPGDCSSGQRRGFFGVELSAKDGAGPTIRLIQDPVNGAVLIVSPAGQPQIVFTTRDCKVLQVQVSQTNTSINEVWNVEGRASIECGEISGDLEFSGCH